MIVCDESVCVCEREKAVYCSSSSNQERGSSVWRFVILLVFVSE